MKTIDEFKKESKRSLRTVQSWIKNGLVNGAIYVDDMYQISDLARPPYMRASSKNSATIRKGIVVACKRRLSINAKVFKELSEYEFNVYLGQVIDLGLVDKREVDGFTYYYATPKADSLTEAQVYQVVKGLTEAAFSAAFGAATEKMLAAQV